MALDTWAARRWIITTTRGHLTAEVLALGNGPLSEPALPAIPGLDTFTGTVFHSARWDHAHDLAGERVAVLGTGASAIQIVPRIQPLARQLTLFQRTPPWIPPRRDHAIPERRRALYRAYPLTRRLKRVSIYGRLEFAVFGFAYRPDLLKRVEALAPHHLEARVKDLALCAKLSPHYAMGRKRILLSDDFYPAVTRENVEVETDPVRAVRGGMMVTDDGKERPVDTIILATGFQVIGMPVAARGRGRGGLHWRPRSARSRGPTWARRSRASRICSS